MDAKVKEAIAVCRAEMEADAKHQMSFGSRHTLLRALGPEVLDAKGRGVELAVGKRRRLRLGLEISKRVAPFWVRDYGTSALDSLLEQIEGYLAGTVALVDVERASLTGGLMNGPAGKDQAWLAGKAVCGTGWVAVHDELLSPDEGVSEEELADPEDPDLWDPAFFAAGAWAGGMPWVPAFSAVAYREFWQWYLDEAVPRAWGAAS